MALFKSFVGVRSAATRYAACRMMSSQPLESYKYDTVEVSSPKEFVYQVQLNRPKKLNSMNTVFWREIQECFNQISDDEDCRSVVLSAKGKVFTAGLDLADLTQVAAITFSDEDLARKAKKLKKIIQHYQEAFSSLEKCTKPVIATVHNACIGAGVDMITAADIRYCTTDSFFQVKEVEVGLAADVGTLQRLPKVVGSDSLARELCYSARKMFADEASRCGLVSRVFDDKESMLNSALNMAELIASKSPVAVQGTKVHLVYSRDHTVQEGLDNMTVHNQAMLQSEDLKTAGMAAMSKETPTFEKL